MMDTVENRDIENKFLAEAKERQAPMIIFTKNGYQVRGIIKDFDDLVILVDSEGREQIVYKHAVSTIAPPYQGSDTKRTAWR